MNDKKCCENCYYGGVSEFLEKRGENCCVICSLRSDIFKGKIYLHSKDDVCRKWRAENDDR